jgi:predicted DsbA family dithiol-disulfide isomerase
MSTTVVAPLLARPTTPKIITLAITHDVICPWCYVAWREIKRAIIRCQQENLPVNFQIQFKPYKLDCTLPTDNCLDKVLFIAVSSSTISLTNTVQQERYISKFGKDRYMGILKVLEERGKNVEINLCVDIQQISIVSF